MLTRYLHNLFSNEPVSSKVNHLRGTRFEEKRKQRF